MKIIFLFFIMFFLIQFTSAQFHWIAPKPQGNTLTSVKFINANIGYAVGYAGTIIKTIDGGNNWSILNPGIFNGFLDLNVIDADICYAVGSGGVIIKTIDGGITWVPQASGITDNLNSVFFLDLMHGYVLSYYGEILKTSDGGNNWIYLTNIGFGCQSVFYINIDTGYVAACGKILKTVDGGNSWTTSLLINPNGCFQSVYFTDDNIGYASFEHDSLYKTTNGGSSWSLQRISGSYYLNSISFLNPDTGFVASETTIWKTLDGGITWIQSLNSSALSVDFADDQKIFAVGQNGAIMKTSDLGNSWVFQNTSNIDNNINSVFFPDSSVGYAVGSMGKIIKSTDGGLNWFGQNSGTFQDLYSVFFIDALTGYAAGILGAILKTTDGGNSWYSSYTGSSASFYSICFVNRDTGFASGDFIFSTYDGGLTWNQGPQSITFSYKSIFFLKDTGYVGGDGIRRTTDNGNSWQWLNSIGNKRFLSMYFADNNTGYAVGYEGIYKTTDGGNNWVEQFSNLSGGLLKSIRCSDANTCYVSHNSYSPDGEIFLKTTDGGNTWTESPIGCYPIINSIYIIKDSTLLAVGNNGVILRSNTSNLVGINSIDSERGIEVFPNPASDKIYIKTKEPGKLFYTIYNIIGSVISQGTITNPVNPVSLEGLSSGVYVIRINTTNNSFQQKIIKE